LQLASFWDFVLNPWAGWQYAHNMSGAAITGAFIMTSVGAFYLLSGKWTAHARIFVKAGVIAGCLFSVLQIFPTGDRQGKMVADLQPVTLAAMEGLFQGQAGAPLVIIGQPNEREGKIDNPIAVPKMLSMLTYKRWNANVRGLDAFPKQDWPDNIPLLYYSYHIMVGLGTFFVAVMAVALLLLWRGRLFNSVDALDPDAGSAFSLHRQYRRMDDRRTRPPALAGVRVDAHRKRLLQGRLGR
jgi:cytochrome bd ubiquinol oxidase subunit I